MKGLKYFFIWLLSALLISFSIVTIPHTSFAAPAKYQIEINKKTNTLYLYKNGKVTKTYPVGTGKKEDLTPEGVFKIGPKIKYPTWYNAEKKKVIPGWKEDYPKGKQENPLGPRWMGLIVNGDSGNTYGIHGTNNENSIGHHVSAGCIRMHVKDVIELFNIVPSGTSVWIHSGTSTGLWMNKPPKINPKEGRIQTTDRVNIRKLPSTSSTSLGKAEKNSQYNITGETQDWYRIKFNGDQVGYISKQYAQIVQPEQQQPSQNPPLQNQPPQGGQGDNDSKPESIQASIQIKASFTKEGALNIESSLQDIKQTDGTWKISLNGKVIHENKNNQTTYTYKHDKADLSGDEIKIQVDYSGSSGGKSIQTSQTQTFTKEKIGMNIKPSFKENKLHIEASLKDHQKALGIWTIQLGKTSKTYLQSGEKLSAVFDSVTFNKKEFPAKVEFKGFINNIFVTAEYEKDLKVLLPNQENDRNDQEKAKNEEPPKTIPESTPETTPITTPEQHQEDSPEDETQENLTSSKEQTTNNDPQDSPSDQEQNTTSEESNDKDEEEPEQKTTSEEESDDDEDSSQQTVETPDTEDEEEDQNSNSQTENVGGELPKTATSYPNLILIGLGFIAISIGLFVYSRHRY